MKGRCSCGEVAYELSDVPLFVHACHCRWCQRETGAAFALNALIEAGKVRLETGVPDWIDTPSESGRGQRIARCPRCQVALWSTYFSPKLYFVRVGTLDDPDACPPDIHIYTESRLSWGQIPEGARRVPQYYDLKVEWPAASLARLDLIRGKPRS